MTLVRVLAAITSVSASIGVGIPGFSIDICIGVSISVRTIRNACETVSPVAVVADAVGFPIGDAAMPVAGARLIDARRMQRADSRIVWAKIFGPVTNRTVSELRLTRFARWYEAVPAVATGPADAAKCDAV